MRASVVFAGLLLVAAVCVDVEQENLAEVGRDLQPAHDAASLGDGVQTMTEAEQAVFKRHMGEVIHKLNAMAAREMGEGIGEDVASLIQHGKLAESNGFIGGLAKMAGKAMKAVGSMAGPGMIKKVLGPKLKSFPPIVQKLIMGAIPYLLKGDINGVKKFLFDTMKKEAIDRIMKLMAKLPDQGLKNMIRHVLEALIKIPLDLKGVLKALKDGLATYGVAKAEQLITTVTNQLPDFLRAPVKGAAMDLLKHLVSLITKPNENAEVARARRLGESEAAVAAIVEKEQMKGMQGFASLLIKEGVKVVGGMVKPMIKKLCAKLPAVLEPAKTPMETTLVKMFEDVVLIVQDPANWNTEGKDKIVKSIIANVKTLAGSLQSIGMDAVKGIIGGEEDKVALKESRGELAKHTGHVAAQLASQMPEARQFGEDLGQSISDGLLQKQHQMLETHDHEIEASEGKRKGKSKKKKRGKKKKKSRGKKKKKGGKKKGKRGGKKKGGFFSSLAKKAGGLAKSVAGGGMGGMINKLLAPLYKKIPADFRPMIQTTVGKLLSGDIPGAKKTMLDGLKKLVMKKAMTFMEPLFKKIPAEFRPAIKGTLTLVLQGDFKGALTALKGHLVTIGIKKIEGIVSMITAALPIPAIREPAKTFIMNTIKDLAKSVTGRELREGMDEATDAQVVAMINKLLLEGVKLVSGMAPGLIDDLMAKFPVAAVREPMSTQLKALVKDVMGVVGDMSNWNKAGFGKIIGLVIKHVKLLGGKLASGIMGEKTTTMRIKYANQAEVQSLSDADEEDNYEVL